mgnify:CR=1 FL=1
MFFFIAAATINAIRALNIIENAALLSCPAALKGLDPSIREIIESICSSLKPEDSNLSMVVSNIINEINFKEDKNVEKHDKNTVVSMYRINLFNVDVNISIGMVNTSMYDNIYFAPVYLVLNENVQVKIGIYEFLAEDYTNLLDKDNDLDIAYIEGPLLFNYVTKEYIEDMMEKYELLELSCIQNNETETIEDVYSSNFKTSLLLN